MREPLAEELGERFIPVVETFANRGTWEAEAVRRLGGVAPSARKVGKSLMNNLYKATFGTPFRDSDSPCFVTCFCTHKPDEYVENNGLLSQWRGYGNSIDGSYCLVFDTKRFEALIEEEEKTYQFAYIGLAVAHYYKDRKSMPPYLEELVTGAAKVLADVLAGGNFPMEGMFIPFVRGATSTKHRGFEEESEVRVVSMPISQLGDERMKGFAAEDELSLRLQRKEEAPHSFVHRTKQTSAYARDRRACARPEAQCGDCAGDGWQGSRSRVFRDTAHHLVAQRQANVARRRHARQTAGRALDYSAQNIFKPTPTDWQAEKVDTTR
jgi:hypothetical protein